MKIRRFHITAGSLTGAALALAVAPAWAQTASGGGAPDLVPVVLWTLVTAGAGLGIVSIGYLYRRERGMNRPLVEPPIPSAAEVEAHDVTRDAAGQELPPHTFAHATGLHADSTEQAEHLVQREAGH
jgi:hypothetical protein